MEDQLDFCFITQTASNEHAVALCVLDLTPEQSSGGFHTRRALCLWQELIALIRFSAFIG